MALPNLDYQHPSVLAPTRPVPQIQERRRASDGDMAFIDGFRRAIYAFGHEKFAEFAVSIAAFGFPAKVEFYADPVAGVDTLMLRLVPQEGARWADGSVKDACSFGLRATYEGRVVEHFARIDQGASAQGERTTACCLHSLTPAVLDRELTSFLRDVLEARAREK